jgi:anti-anti-sigma factor
LEGSLIFSAETGRRFTCHTICASQLHAGHDVWSVVHERPGLSPAIICGSLRISQQKRLASPFARRSLFQLRPGSIVTAEVKSGVRIVRVLLTDINLFESRNVQNAVLEAADQERSIVLDLSAVQLLDSSALIMLLKIAEFFQARGGELTIYGVRQGIREAMSATYVDHLVEIVSSEADAIARCTQPGYGGAIVKRIHNALIFRGESRYNVIPLDQISHLSANGRTTTIHTLDKSFTASRLLKDMKARLPDSFLRIHRGFVVNARHVRALQYAMGGTYQVTLGDRSGTVLPVGRVYASALKAALQKLGTP